jgi:Zn finger protein HypA/HybF involved in hydrogenase expression
MLCFYQCGKEASFTLKNGNACCAEQWKDCPASKAISGSNKGRKFVSTSDMLVQGSLHATGAIKERVIQDELLTHTCSECSLESVWNGKPIVLELDHINGVSNDNRLENLRFLCPNCHSQTTTFRGRGINGKMKVSDTDLMSAYNESKNIRQALIKVGLVPKGGNYTRLLKLIEQK